MSKERILTLAFLDQAPRAATKEIQSLPLPEAAALIEAVPTRYCRPIFQAMIPWHAARLLESVSAAKAAAIVRQVSFEDSVTLARLIAPAVREELFEAMPTRYALRLRNALEYPHHQVGAWVDPDVPTLRDIDTVEDAIRVLRAGDPASHVFLEAASHEKFLGTIELREIFRSDPATPLSQLDRVESMPISNRATLSSLAFDERWDDFLHLPVTGRRGNLLGGLSRKTLRHAMHEQHVADSHTGHSLLREVLSAFSVAVSGLLNLVTAPPSQATAAVTGEPNRE